VAVTVAAAQIVGTWRLTAFERWVNGAATYPMGREARGYVSYDAQGRMSIQVMRPDRPPVAAGDLAQGTAEELRTIVAGYLSYAGTYEVDMAAGRIIHHVDVHLSPNAVGSRLERRFELSGDRLTLYTSPAAADGRLEGGRLTWERVA
jgi:hypothetical protein